MCMGLASGYREPVRKSLLKEDPTEKFKETVCDGICRYPWETSSQEDLDDNGKPFGSYTYESGKTVYNNGIATKQGFCFVEGKMRRLRFKPS